MSTETPKWTVGQEVILRESRRRTGRTDTPVVITKVGRSYVYVERYGRPAAFHIEDGVEKGEGYAATCSIGTPESLAARDHRDSVMSALSKATRDHGWTRNLSTEDAERIVAIIAAANA